MGNFLAGAAAVIIAEFVALIIYAVTKYEKK